jgi:hypothetical protein
MGLVYFGVFLSLVLIVLVQRALLRCLDHIERGQIQAPNPIPLFFTRETRKFFDFVLLGRYRTSSDAAVLRSFGIMRALLVAQLLLFVSIGVYLVTMY